MLEKEEYIGKSKLKDNPKSPLNFKLKDNCVKTQHLEDGAVTTPKIKDGAVTPEKRSNNFDNEVVKPYTYLDIWRFYGIEEHYIQVLTEKGVVWLDRNNPSVIINNNPFVK